MDLNYYGKDFTRLKFMGKLKKKTRPIAESRDKFAVMATIAYHSKELNALVSPAFLKVRDRMISCLKPSVALYMRKSPKDLEEFVREHLSLSVDPSTEFVASLNPIGDIGSSADFVCGDSLEADYEKFDKNANFRKIEIENELYKRFGLSWRFVEEWLADQERTVVKSYESGIKFMKIWQRSTGTAPTALGNSIVTATSFPAAYDVWPDGFKFLLVLGDDSYGVTRRPMRQLQNLTERVARVYNLQVKMVSQATTRYFCSYFILDSPDGVIFVADPIKTMLKLGEAQIVVDGKTFLGERWISFKDTMRHYDDESVFESLALATSERYPKYSFSDCMVVVRALAQIASTEQSFRDLFEEPQHFFM